MTKFNYTFDSFWKSIRPSVQNKGKNSMWYLFFRALFSFVFKDFQSQMNLLYSQIFRETQTYESLVLEAADMRIYPRSGETEEEFETRFNKEKLLRENDLNTDAIKNIFGLFLGVEADIQQTANIENIFTIGSTKIGEGKVYAANYFRFTWTAYLPDCSNLNFNKNEIISMLNEFSCSSEFFVVERRNNNLWGLLKTHKIN